MKREFTVALCDSQKNELSDWEAVIKDWLTGLGRENTAVDLFFDAVSLKERLSDGYGADIYVLGVHAHSPAGLELARAIRLRQPDAPMILIADTRAFAYEAYELHVIRYMLRTAPEEELVSALDLAHLICRASPSDTVSVRMTGEVRNVNADDVVFVENNVRSMRYVLRDGNVLTGTRRNISFEQFFAPLLGSGRFVQPHKSFIVNIRYIRSIKGTSVLMTNGVQIPISRRHITEVQEAYRKFGS